MKILRKIGFTLLITVSVIMLAVMLMRSPLPDGQAGKKAEELTDQILEAVNKEGWDGLKWISWDFMGQHQYIWNKAEDLAVIQYGNTRVHLNLNSIRGSAWENGELLDGHKSDKAIQKAWKYWCNDSYWLNPTVKIRDDGTIRKLVKLEDGSDALLVSYKDGGVTPGDSYLYVPDENGLPRYWKMWVSILPITGIKTRFENYQMIGENVPIAQDHYIGPVNVKIREVKAGDSFSDLGLNRDPFLNIE